MERNIGKQRELLKKVSLDIVKIPMYQPTTDYNIFQVLGVEAKEVIMCRFLADLLNPNGAHNKGFAILKSFLENVIGMNNISDQLLQNTCVVREYVIEGDRRIDIAIENYQFFIPIEVKIYADDQENQCFDYYKYAKNSKIIYLTRFASEPSNYSRNDLPLDSIKCIGWEKDIIPWLRSAITNVDSKTAYMIEQYMDAIHSVADEREEVIMEHTIEIIKESEDAFSAALEIEKAMKAAKIKLIREVFEEFELQMKPYCEKYGLKKESEAEYYIYDEKRQEKYYDNYNGTFPGLNYVVEKAEKFEDKIQLWFRIEVEHNLFAGFTLFDFSATPKDGNKVGYQVQEITPEMYSFAEKYLDHDIFIPDADWWLSFCYSNGIIEEGNYEDVPNFKEMNTCAISLVNPENRKMYVQDTLSKFEEHLLKKIR